MLNCKETAVPFHFVKIPSESDSRPYDVLTQHKEFFLMYPVTYMPERLEPTDKLIQTIFYNLQAKTANTFLNFNNLLWSFPKT